MLNLVRKMTAHEATQEALAGLKQATADHPGQLVGERLNHRGWPPDVVLAFLYAEVIKPVPGEIQQRLYGR